MSPQESPQRLVKQAQNAYRSAHYREAAQLFKAAQAAYEQRDDALMAAEMANNASVAYLQAGDGAQALAVVEGTPQVFAAKGDLRRQGMALGNRAAALEALERYDEAEEEYLHAAAVLQEAGEDQLRAQTMQALSALQLRRGQRLQALASMYSGLEEVRHPTPKQSFVKRLLAIPVEMLTGKKGKF